MRLHAPASTEPDQPASSIVHQALGRFSVEVDAAYPHMVCLMLSNSDSGGAKSIWSRHFGDLADRDTVLERFQSGGLDLTFLARVTMIFGQSAITAAVDQVVERGRAARRAQAEAEAKRQKNHKIINLYAPDTKHAYKLELRRKSNDVAEWSVRYDRASERDRLCDWLRWQVPRFGEFLDHAAKYGNEALTRLFTDEMFEAERRVKKEGRGAGGLRPLRMWRGD
ncbi:MAG: hypothetical protein DI632_00015 [Sphingomonas hengshuiensis]|uniref:Uncharacterized protein n=1 Tax=Sphingomonas hengshuiensis TaxID=1609977 RepID=A0A2W4ZK09_9SPHN|nr:MAG: hypothetical protein DI632_00015 [Sphingomonas hengshuiensis]